MSSIKHERAIVNSALWAAAGDALGWITELGREETVRARTGAGSVHAPVRWKRRIGGRGGVYVVLPEGTYSDDTQLRLAVCRSIRGDGTFDPETFARIELTTWQSYALGAGLGSKAAAANLAKRGVNWFSNFFESKSQSYFRGGGNGAAMRVQPHVWSRKAGDVEFLSSVLKDAIITHGHPHGFCGAIFHALTLADTIESLAIPNPGVWAQYVMLLYEIPLLVQRDRHLSAFWSPAWSSRGVPLEAAIYDFVREAEADLKLVEQLLVGAKPSSYLDILRELGCFEDRYRGSGWKTALAAAALAWLYRERSVEEGLAAAANALGSDTDTIGTMAGALLGATSMYPPEWNIQDARYIETEARRLSAISRGEQRDSFSYPDPAKWAPPATQSDSVLLYDGAFAVAGLGPARPVDEEHSSGAFTWQWLELPFGQTVLAKRKKLLTEHVRPEQLPGNRRAALSEHQTPLQELPLERERSKPTTRVPLPTAPRAIVASPQAAYPRLDSATSNRAASEPTKRNGNDIDGWSDAVIQSNFDDAILGKMFNRCIDELGSIEGAVAFAGILAKAKLTRMRRNAK